jgi:aminobenzoyl-glutamate utilization protein B
MYRSIIRVALIGVLAPVGATALQAGSPNGDSAAVAANAAVASHSKLLTDLAEQVYALAETSLRETKSAALLADAMEKAGFRVTRNLDGIATAFLAEAGSGKPVIGLLAEYDALPGLSQKAGASEKQPVVEGGAGHGCGHNLLGTASIGGALAVREVLESRKIPGTIRLYGCPAEEAVSAKSYLVRDGFFKDVDAVVAWHPDQRTRTHKESSYAMNDFEVIFHGKSAHAAGAPWDGRSALDAVELFDMAVNQMREHVEPTARMHYVITDGGRAPNVVPDRAAVWYFVRDLDRNRVDALYARVLDAAKGAALATGTTHEVNLHSALSNILDNKVLARVVQKQMDALGDVAFDEKDQAYAKALERSFGVEERGVVTTPEPITGPPLEKLSGSSDVAEVSWTVPTTEFGVATAPIGIPHHSWAFASAAGSPLGEKGMLYAARVMAGAVLDLFTDAKLRDEARAEFQSSTGGRPYVSPLPKDKKPELPP